MDGKRQDFKGQMRKQLLANQWPQYQQPRRWRLDPLERLELGIRYYKRKAK